MTSTHTVHAPHGLLCMLVGASSKCECDAGRIELIHVRHGKLASRAAEIRSVCGPRSFIYQECRIRSLIRLHR